MQRMKNTTTPLGFTFLKHGLVLITLQHLVVVQEDDKACRRCLPYHLDTLGKRRGLRPQLVLRKFYSGCAIYVQHALNSTAYLNLAGSKNSLLRFPRRHCSRLCKMQVNGVFNGSKAVSFRINARPRSYENRYYDLNA